MKKKLIIATTVPETLAVILRDQPKFLNIHFDVSLVTSTGTELGLLSSENVPIHIVPMKRGISPAHDFVSLCRMILLFRSLRPDIVHSYTPKAGLVCMLAAWICRVPVRIHTFTGLIWPTQFGLLKVLLKMVDRILCSCATYIIPEGLGVLADLKSGQITIKPLEVIGHGNIAGVDVEYFSPLSSGLSDKRTNLLKTHLINQDDFVFAYIGRLNRDKGINELLAAFVKLPDHCRLLLVGALDETKPISPDTRRILDSHPRVHWLGFQQDVRPALLVANVLVLPSYREGFPNVVLQSGAMERPVIATNISGSNEAITPDFNGWLVLPGNAKDLELTMLQALAMPTPALHELGRNARQRVVARYERSAHWQRMLNLYHYLICK
jgi:glycosyltransferase involved in cell wall biosynthesis